MSPANDGDDSPVEAGVAVRVVDGAGRPVAAAELSLRAAIGAPRLPGDPTRTGATDDAGRFSFAVPATGTYAVEATAVGLGEAFAPSVRPGSSVVLRLEEFATLDGAVLDAETSSPIPVAMLIVDSTWSSRVTHSGVDGRFRLSVPVEGARIEALASGYTPRRVWVRPGRDPVTLPLARAPTRPGRVVDEHGNGIPAAVIELRAERTIDGQEREVVLVETRSAGDGRFTIPLPPVDDARVVASSAGRGATSRAVEELEDGAVVLRIGRGREIAGVVELADGTAGGRRTRRVDRSDR